MIPRENLTATDIFLNDKTRELFEYNLTENRDLTHIIQVYKNYIINKTNQLHTNYENAYHLYSSIFKNYTILLTLPDLSTHKYATKLNFNEMCQYITPNFTLKTVDFIAFESIFDNSIQNDKNMDVNILDSKSLYKERNEFNIETPIQNPSPKLNFRF